MAGGCLTGEAAAIERWDVLNPETAPKDSRFRIQDPRWANELRRCYQLEEARRELKSTMESERQEACLKQNEK